MTELEKETRRRRIDPKLTSAPLHWVIIPWKKGLDTSTLEAHVVTEYPTESGPADYAFFVNGRLLGVMEAKKRSFGIFFSPGPFFPNLVAKDEKCN